MIIKWKGKSYRTAPEESTVSTCDGCCFQTFMGIHSCPYNKKNDDMLCILSSIIYKPMPVLDMIHQLLPKGDTE